MKVRVETLRYDEVVLLEDAGHPNARFMKHQTFQQLVGNVRKDGVLTQLAFCIKYVSENGATVEAAGGRWLVVSGNHRVKAARTAGLAEGLFLVTEDPLTWDEVKAIQLSHNSISGQDDPAVLKQVYESIQAIDLKQYAGLDDKTLELLAKIGTEPAPSASLEWTTISFLFLPDEVEGIKRVIKLAEEIAKGEQFATRMADYERFMQALALIGAAHNIKNTATALALILAVFERHLTELQDGWVEEKNGEATAKHKGWVPLASLFGSTTVPPAAALVIRKALQRAVDTGDVTVEARWRLFELLAADYLSGSEVTH